MKPIRPTLTALAVLVLFPLSHAVADTITGRVVDANNVGVANVDIDVKNLGGGGDPPLTNAGTDANGFFATTLPAGVYRVIFTPPPPPASTSLTLEVEPVAVVGTTAMGTIALPPGVSLSGHVENGVGEPVAGVNLDVIDKSNGDNLDLSNDFTDAFGNFSIAVPAGPIELRFDATPVVGPTLASTSMGLAPTGNTVLADVVLVRGYSLSGTVRDMNGFAVQEADIDVFDAATGAKIYTPGEETNGAGVFSFVVPAGIWNIAFCPDLVNRLVAKQLSAVAISASTSLGTIVLEDGVVLSGIVRDFNGTPVAGADVDVAESSNGATVTLCGDDTNGSGAYAVVVPARTLDVRFEPPSYTVGLGRDPHAGVIVAGNTTLDGALPQCLVATNYGVGLAPAGGGPVPHITSSGGVPSEGNPNWSIELSDGVPGGTAYLVLSLAPASTPRFGGTLLVSLAAGQAFLFLVPLDGSGVATFGPVNLAGGAGFSGYAQFAVLAPSRVAGGNDDAAAAGSWSLSEGLQIDFCH